MQYFRNQGDQYDDPDLIAAQYQVGRNAYFEVQLTLAEYADSNSSLHGGLQGSPNFIQVISGGVGPVFGCPEVSQYIWIDDYKTIKAKELVKRIKDARVYNPITRNFNLLIAAEIIESPLFKIRTTRGIENIVSQTDKIITSPSDMVGVYLNHYGVGRDILTFDEGRDKRKKHWNIYSDTLVEIADAGVGEVVKFSLDKEFIYASGITKTEGVCHHNSKPPPE